MEGELKDGRKIQFSVPSAASTQLDPRQVEMIRRRRPTPATLFCTADHPSPDEEASSLQLFVCENGNLKPKKLDTVVYQPPSLTVQKMAEAHVRFHTAVQDSPSPESSGDEDSSPGAAKVDAATSDQSDHSASESSADEDEEKEKSENRTDERGKNKEKKIHPSDISKSEKLEESSEERQAKEEKKIK
ncbi:protein phosphatase 1 regulatory subunit 1B-like isoform X2 [Trichomycterus rosablanca]|uniref:protein phosphatase 1 regulatory subunit 1B-like isoform X2 n=1 Tax=Trichomycterus rosablanca TaxID=2290929 RepID=UPI002F35E359